MVLTQFSSEGLDGLCSKEQLQLLDAIDSLRSQGISHYISLPQIIVCGDQSSGKSSVLEAISGVSFPVKSSLCTCFPTELILRKTTHTSVKVSIVPHHSRSKDEKASLSDFHEKLESFQELPDLIENAKAAMGIMTLGKAFSKDLLRIEISGPDRPHLTIVDLPGLIHSETKHQSASDIGLIADVVQSYMKEPRSIILAVVSAKNDYANQIVLKLARAADRQGTRTLGVITKPDTLAPGSDSENMYISLTKNMDVEFRLGWHVLRNRDTDNEKWALAQRDLHEAEFFSSGAWASLPVANLGIKALRDRLSQLLLRQIASELPNLLEEIASKYTRCQKQLELLGQPRTNPHEQRIYLVQVSQAFQAVVQAAIEGTYTDPFFGDITSVSGYQKRVRAVVQNLSRDFAKKLSNHGRRYKIVPDPEVRDDGGDDGGSAILITRADFVAKVVTMMDRGRGRELPGTFSPMIVVDLFREQSSRWETIARNYVKEVWNAVKKFLKHLIAHISDPTTVSSLMERVLNPQLDTMLANLLQKTAELLKPHQSGHPITYNDHFTETVNKIRFERLSSHYEKVVQNHFGNVSKECSIHVSSYVHFGNFMRELERPLEPDLNRWAASEALDFSEAYYEVALKRLIDDIAVEVVENCLMAEIGKILSPLDVALMSEEDMSRIAGEKEKSRAVREELKAKLKVLQHGTETCKEFAGFRALDLDDDEKTSDVSSDYDQLESHSKDRKVTESDTNQSKPYDNFNNVWGPWMIPATKKKGKKKRDSHYSTEAEKM